MPKRCLVCGEEIIKKYNESKRFFEGKKTCSRKCFHKRHADLLRGRKRPKEVRIKISKKLKGRKIKREWVEKANKTKRDRGSLTKEKNPNWKGGRWIDKDGYIRNPKEKWNEGGATSVREHRRKMEQYLNRKLTRNEIIHHRNEIKSDNRIENLQIMTRSEHAKLHAYLRKLNNQ